MGEALCPGSLSVAHSPLTRPPRACRRATLPSQQTDVGKAALRLAQGGRWWARLSAWRGKNPHPPAPFLYAAPGPARPGDGGAGGWAGGRADGRTGGRADGRTGGRADGRTGGRGWLASIVGERKLQSLCRSRTSRPKRSRPATMGQSHKITLGQTPYIAPPSRRNCL
jgi:hypothetical protein